MLPYATRAAQAQSYHDSCMERMKTTPVPKGQKFMPGTRVRICKDLGRSMSHFTSDCLATVKHTYAHAFGGGDVDSYCLDLDGHGESSWYHEWQLTEVAQ